MRLLCIIVISICLAGLSACSSGSRGKSELDKKLQELYELNREGVEYEQQLKQGKRLIEQDIANKEKFLADRQFEMDRRQQGISGFINRLFGKGPTSDNVSEKRGSPESILERYEILYSTLHPEQEDGFADLREGVDTSLAYPFDTLANQYEVFGWHPYWMNGAYKGYNFNLLSTIAFFAYDINPIDGSYRDPSVIQQWKTTGLIDSAHKARCKVLLTISNHGQTNNQIFLSNQIAQENLIDSLIFLLRFRNADGVDIDFENISSAYGPSLTNFVSRLHSRLSETSKDYFISLCLPSVDRGEVFDLDQLSQWVDLFVIMGYDLHGSKSKVAGPIAPLNSGKLWDSPSLTSSLSTYSKRGISRNKLIIALPYYGTMWKTSTDSLGAKAHYFSEHLTYKEIKTYDPYIYEHKYEPISQSKYFVIKDGLNGYKQCWYEDSLTLNLKMDWIQRQGLAGVGIWALGYDYGRKEMWGLIANRFGKNSGRLKDDQKIRQRYGFIALVREYQYPLIGGGIFILFFLMCGFILSLTDWRVRDALFYSGSSRVIYAGLLFGLIVAILALAGVLTNKSLILAGGLLAGLVATMLISRITINRRRRLP